MMLNIREVAELTAVSKPTIYRWLSDPKCDFPRPVRLGPNSVRWREADVVTWLESREPTTPQAVA